MTHRATEFSWAQELLPAVAERAVAGLGDGAARATEAMLYDRWRFKPSSNVWPYPAWHLPASLTAPPPCAAAWAAIADQAACRTGARPSC